MWFLSLLIGSGNHGGTEHIPDAPLYMIMALAEEELQCVVNSTHGSSRPKCAPPYRDCPQAVGELHRYNVDCSIQATFMSTMLEKPRLSV
jgi:hypothetical protein